MDVADRQYKYDVMNCLAPALALTIKKGDIERVNALLEIGADVNERGSRNSQSERFTPLYWACVKGHVDIVRLLLNRGADVDVKNYYGTALYWACKRGHAEIARFLIDAGAKVNFPKGSALLPLSGACENKDPYLVKFLLATGAKANGKDHFYSNSPLHFACTGEIARLLLEAGADINAKNEKDDTPIHAAAHAGRAVLVQFLVNAGVNPDCRGHVGTTALHYASAKGSVETVRFLLEAGADVNAKNLIGHDSFDFATHNGITADSPGAPVIPILLEHGADPSEDKLERVFQTTVRMNGSNPNRGPILTWYQENRPELYFSAFCTTAPGPGGI